MNSLSVLRREPVMAKPIGTLNHNVGGDPCTFFSLSLTRTSKTLTGRLGLAFKEEFPGSFIRKLQALSKKRGLNAFFL